MSNFAFLTSDFPAVHDAARSAERHAASDPVAAAFLSGKAMELAVKWVLVTPRRLPRWPVH